MVDGGKSELGVGEKVLGVRVDDDAGHGSVVDAIDEGTNVDVAAKRRGGFEKSPVARLFAVPCGGALLFSLLIVGVVPSANASGEGLFCEVVPGVFDCVAGGRRD